MKKSKPARKKMASESSLEADVRIAKEERPSKALAAVGQEDVPVVVRGESSEGVFNAAWLQSQGCGDATAGPLACGCPMPFLQMSQQVVPEPVGWGVGGMMAPDGGDALSHLPEDSRPLPCLVACDVAKKTSAVVPVHAAIRCALLVRGSRAASNPRAASRACGACDRIAPTRPHRAPARASAVARSARAPPRRRTALAPRAAAV
jgi:hypothetical protein